jgi:glycosyltransferase involved in cell wall biosynthesis
VKIAIVHFGALQPGGYPPDTRALAAALAATGHDVTLVTDPGPRSEGTGGARVVAPAAATDLTAFDAVHLMGVLRPRQIAYLVRCLPAGAPLVVSPLTQLSAAHLRRSRAKKLPYVPLLRRVARRWPVVLHGFSATEVAESRRFLAAAATFVAPSGVFEGPGVSWRGDGGYMLFFGRNDVHQKGLDLLLDAYAAYRRAGGTTPLLVAGQPWGSSEAELRRRAVPGVTLLGPVQDREKWTLLARAHALFFLSRWDGPPRPIREALSVGCPVVVSPGTHMADLVEESAAGAAVAFDAGVVAPAMTASDDRSTRERWAQGAAALRDRLAWRHVAGDYVEGYRLAARPAARAL